MTAKANDYPGIFLGVSVTNEGAVRSVTLQRDDAEKWWKAASTLVRKGAIRHARYFFVRVGSGTEGIEPCSEEGARP